MNTPDGEKIVYVDLKNNGQPRYARETINKLALVSGYAKAVPFR